MNRPDLFHHPLVFAVPDRMVEPQDWVEHVPLAFFLTSVLRPRLFVELGVFSGMSYNAFCQAVDALGLGTRCYGIDTWRGDDHTGPYGPEVYHDLLAYQRQRYGSFSSLLQTSFDEARSSFSDRSIDLLHLDGFHTYEAVRYDVDAWLPKLSEQGVLLLHDISVRERDFGVWRLWDELSAEYPSFGLRHGNGLGILAVGSQVPAEFLAWLEETSQGSSWEMLFRSLGERLHLRWRQDRVAEGNLDQARHARALEAQIREKDRYAASLAEACTQREADLAVLHQLLAEKDRYLATLQPLLREKEACIASLQEHLAEKDRYLATLQPLLREKEACIASLQEHLAEKDRYLATLQPLLQEKDADLVSLHQASVSHDHESRALRQTIAEKEAYVASLQEHLAEKDRYLATLQPLLQEKDRYIASLLKTLEAKDADITALLATINGRERPLP